jgi:hypothetical protein
VFNDAQFALGSLLLVSVLVLVQLRSPFLALYAMYELLIAFPAVYGVYMYACQLESVNLLTGVALFLVIGIGVDDLFVFYYCYLRAHARHPHAPALCLAETYRTATLATFGTCCHLSHVNVSLIPRSHLAHDIRCVFGKHFLVYSCTAHVRHLHVAHRAHELAAVSHAVSCGTDHVGPSHPRQRASPADVCHSSVQASTAK